MTEINTNIVAELTDAQARTATKLETKVDNWQTGFRDAGEALATLKDRTLYVGTWEDYVLSRFDLTYSKANRLIVAARITAELEEAGFKVLPANEGQANELAPMKPEERLAVWKKVLAEGGRPTMGKIKEAKRLGLPQAKVKSPLRPCINKLETAKRKLKKVVDELPSAVTETEKEPFRRRITEMRGILDRLTERLDAGAEAKAA